MSKDTTKKGDIQENNLFSFSDVLPDKKIQSTTPPMNNVGYKGYAQSEYPLHWLAICLQLEDRPKTAESLQH